MNEMSLENVTTMINEMTGNLPPRVVRSYIYKTFIKKCTDDPRFASLRKDFLNFREEVLPYFDLIRTLFDEYTPHDEPNHIATLFALADELLGRNCIKKLNAEELFVLVCALYGHDMGMGLSKPEMAVIARCQSGEVTTNNTGHKEVIPLLTDEETQLRSFLVSSRCLTGDAGNTGSFELTKEEWQNYARKTHHLRVVPRIHRLLRNNSHGLGGPVALVCAAHGYSIQAIRKTSEFDPAYGTIDATLNLQALAIYVRLIDLFDITANRTPYKIWHLFYPSNEYSSLEWLKHRAISSVKCNESSCLIVKGAASTNRIYTALEDLRDYCEKELKENLRLLDEPQNSKNRILISRLTWDVKEPKDYIKSVRTEVDRERIIELLSSEIYDRDPYVFIRELLQNSIDACELRARIFGENVFESKCPIHFNVEYLPEDGCKIICTDEGIGMDVGVISDFFAVAGRSYCQGEEYKESKIEIDHISRFGIGFLSCYMYGEEITVKTRRHMYRHQHGDPIIIKIPGRDLHWVLEKGTNDMPIGTSISVRVSGRKLPGQFVRDGWKYDGEKRLDVGGYLRAIAGFVRFPILVEERYSQDVGEVSTLDNSRSKKTLILPPNTNSDDLVDTGEKSTSVSQLRQEYPLADLFIQPSSDVINKFFHLYSLDLIKHIKGCTGTLAYPVPKSLTYDLAEADNNQIQLWNLDEDSTMGDPLEFKEKYQDISLLDFNQSLSSLQYKLTAVYRNGILVSNWSTQDYSKIESIQGKFVPMLACNLTTESGYELNAGRDHLQSESGSLTSRIEKSRVDLVLDGVLRQRSSSTDYEFRHAVGFSVRHHMITPDSVFERYKISDWPMLTLRKNGEISTTPWSKISGNPIYALPSEINEDVYSCFNFAYPERTALSPLLNKWQGETCFVLAQIHRKRLFSVEGQQRVDQKVKNSQIYRQEIRLIIPPAQDMVPLEQIVEIPISKGNEPLHQQPKIDEILNQIRRGDDIDIKILQNIGTPFRPVCAAIYSGPESLDKYFYWGFGRVCVKHTVGRFLVFLGGLIMALEVEGKHGQGPNDLAPQFHGFCSHLQAQMAPYPPPFNILRLNDFLGRLFLCAQQIDTSLPFNQDDLVLSLGDFLCGSVVNIGDGEFRVVQQVVWSQETLSNPKPWGTILGPSDVWPVQD